MRANEIQQLPRGLALMIPERHPPLLVRTQPYDADLYLRALAELQSAAQERSNRSLTQRWCRAQAAT